MLTQLTARSGVKEVASRFNTHPCASSRIQLPSSDGIRIRGLTDQTGGQLFMRIWGERKLTASAEGEMMHLTIV